MIQKAHIADEKIIKKISSDYNIQTKLFEFLPVGEASWCYKVTDHSNKQWFIKLTTSDLYKPSVLIPYFLQHQQHNSFIFSAEKNISGELIDTIENFCLALYPYIEGKEARYSEMTPLQWTTIGSYMYNLHTTQLPSNLFDQLQKETFTSRWGENVEQILEESQNPQTNSIPQNLAKFIEIKREEIHHILHRTQELGQQIIEKNPQLVLCHGDIHTANIFLTPENTMYIIDWDNVQIAPIERDIMFFTSDIYENFMKGYNPKNDLVVDPLIIAYYKYEWVVQEFADYGQRVFFHDLNTVSKQHALDEFYKLFNPDDVIDGAYSTEESIQ